MYDDDAIDLHIAIGGQYARKIALVVDVLMAQGPHPCLGGAVLRDERMDIVPAEDIQHRAVFDDDTCLSAVLLEVLLARRPEVGPRSIAPLYPLATNRA